MFIGGFIVSTGLRSSVSLANTIHMKVIPGPCGFLRREAVTDEILDEVRRVVTNPTERDTLIQGNIKVCMRSLW